ncbi:CheR family methyltransferase [Flavitalea sp. BT771]|uniref:CheR family methyltransferase n=1 Tax=Flavitalea sp. BT771 TaxID=3063329 RepID=UPI0026E35319|nr:CheR family methyltransferase [Flavitalea sp. BT771]MDO6429752.1 CheR family methyltransferase [Flavitalea sp. BT771]MDV6218120.1 CheR family methyltransferase [Flavitalea sp. BT771]
MANSKKEDVSLPFLPGLFPVVGVGASAGGLDAFRRMLRAIPEHPAMAFILVQHLEPTHESLLPDILQRVTSTPILEITDNVLMEPGRIYIIPSNKLLTVSEGRLQLSPRLSDNARNRPIDLFFTSLAEVYQGQAIGIVLSGTGTDGTLGLKAIKEHGGFTFAQQPLSTASPGMPQSAIDAEVVDFVLAPEEIPLQLVRLAETSRNGLAEGIQEVPHTRENAFRELLYILRARKGTDFAYYKQTTVRRRIIRRMGLNKIQDVEAYLAFFKENTSEQELLYQDLLIPVTSFFRDPKVYSFLCESIFPQLLKEKDMANPLRIWIAGCSTGEEPYSMAICLCEYLGARTADVKIQIFATDISERSIAKARSGLYSRRDVEGLSPARLQQYFTKVNGSFQINKSIRDMCVFACHNFLKDPPFARMDLISCRNVLIYMDPILQKRALKTFHYALKANGYLLLGNSETIAPTADLFTVIGKHEKLYIRKAVAGRTMPLTAERATNAPGNMANMIRKEPSRDDFQKSADEAILTKYAPPGVVVNEHFDIVQFRGSTGTWLEPSPGKPSHNVLKMAREGLAFELRNALHKAKTNNKAEVKGHIPFLFMGKKQSVTIEIAPLSNTVEPYYLILFREEMVLQGSSGHPQTGVEADPAMQQHSVEGLRIEQLERELAQLREDMRSITEDQEAVNEELQSANEELLSGSEELQSLNEELETSKEEIQSTNEELTTLNQELVDRNEQLILARQYAESIVATIREPLVVLDKQMRVKTANRAYYDKFNTSEEDTEGKSFFSLGKGQWDLPGLHAMLDGILTVKGRITDFEVRHRFDGAGDSILYLNASRIFQNDTAEPMILLALEDVTQVRRREDELERKVKERTSSLMDANISLTHSNNSLEQYATIASHDLQEPLRKIRTFAAILNKQHSREVGDEARLLLQKINASAERMSALIQDVLNFAKVLDSSIFENVDLNLVLENVINDFDLLIEQKEALVHHDPLPVIQAVPLQMNQLFYNLLSNALKFAKAEVPPLINISSRILTEEETGKHAGLKGKKPYLEIVFRDNGIGFEPHFRKQIFEIFQRLNAISHFEGTGIGLALCQRIVSNHRGEITAESRPGEGASFQIILPMEQ